MLYKFGKKSIIPLIISFLLDIPCILFALDKSVYTLIKNFFYKKSFVDANPIENTELNNSLNTQLADSAVNLDDDEGLIIFGKQYSRLEQGILKRRVFLLIAYLFKMPIYEYVTKERILRFGDWLQTKFMLRLFGYALKDYALLHEKYYYYMDSFL